MAVNIIGGTVEKGLGGRRQSRTPDYSGGNIRLNTGGVRTGVGLGSGRINIGAAGTIRAPQLSARQAIPFIQDTPTAEGPLIAPETFNRGMTDLASAATRYADETAALHAKQATLVFSEGMFKLFHGDPETRGFKNAEGFEAADGYQAYSATIDQAMKKSLEGLNPAARQKAVMEMFAVRNSYLNKGSEHAVSERGKIDEMHRQNERQLVENELFAYPPDGLPTVVKGEDGKITQLDSQLKQRFFSTYSVNQLTKAQNEWESRVSGVAGRIYLDNAGRLNEDGEYVVGSGLEDVKQYRDTVASSELSGDALLALDQQIRQWENSEINAFISNRNSKRVADTKELEREQSTRGSELFISLWDKDIESKAQPHEVMMLAKAGMIKHSTAIAYGAAYRKQMSGEKISTNMSDYSYLRRRVETTMDNNFIDAGGNSVLEDVLTYGEIDGTDRKALINKFYSAKDTRQKSQVKQLNELLDAAIPTIYNIYDEKTNDTEILHYRATQRYNELIAQGVEHSKALSDVEIEFSKVGTWVTALPPVFGQKPTTIDQYEAVLNAYELKSKNGMTPEEANRTGKILERYLQLIERGVGNI